jgi:hypothetical protein
MNCIDRCISYRSNKSHLRKGCTVTAAEAVLRMLETCDKFSGEIPFVRRLPEDLRSEACIILKKLAESLCQKREETTDGK